MGAVQSDSRQDEDLRRSRSTGPLRVAIAGGGIAALELALALHDLAEEQTEVLLIAPNHDFVYRPYSVREPFGFAPAARYPLQRIAEEAGATLIVDELSWVEPRRQALHTAGGREIRYGALALAPGAQARPRFKHALTIDDRRLDEILHGLVQDVEEGFVHRVAFIVPPRMPWPLPIYELALMTAARAYDMNVQIEVTIVTPEEAPLAIFGSGASDAVAGLLHEAQVKTVCSAFAEVSRVGEVSIEPGDRRLEVDRIVALPELYGPAVRGLPVGPHGFLTVDVYGRMSDVGPVFAAGDAVDFAVKHGGISSQQADVAARSIAALAGVEVQPIPFQPVITGMLLTGERPRYLSARITGGHGFSSEVTDAPMWSPPGKVVSKYLGPLLHRLDAEAAS